jgi:hypothetical protein
VPVDGTTPSYESGFAIVSSLNADYQTVTLKMIVPIADVVSYPFDWSGQGYSTVYIESPAKTNGDYMRGHYMNVYLRNSSTSPVECFAFNVNYEPTKLDHSLGQNA